jgi:hypothetical protein
MPQAVKGNPKGKRPDPPNPLFAILFILIGGCAFAWISMTHDDAHISAFIHKMFYPAVVHHPEHTTDDVRVVDDFLSAEECDELIKMASDKLVVSYQADVTGKKMESTYRTSQSTVLPHLDTHTFRAVNKRIASISGYGMDHFQEMQVARYTSDQTYGLHRDEHEEQNRAGGRVATVLIYLADECTGGETLFTRQPLEQLDNLTKLAEKLVHFKGYCSQRRDEHLHVAPKKGRAVFWRSFSKEGNKFIANSTHGACPGRCTLSQRATHTHTTALYLPHSAHTLLTALRSCSTNRTPLTLPPPICTVVDGEKWVMQQWISKDRSNVVNHPQLLAYLPLGSGKSWGVAQLTDLAGEHGRVKATIKKSLKSSAAGIGPGMESTVLKGKCASIEIGGNTDFNRPKSASHGMDERSVAKVG